MDFTFYKNDMAEALKFVTKFAAVKPPTPILAAVLLDVNPAGSLKLSTNNLDSAATCVIPCSCQQNFTATFAVDAQYLKAVVNKCDNDTINIFADEHSFRVKSGSATFDMLQFNADDFPQIKTHENFPIQIRAVTFKELIDKTVFATSKKDERPLFRGINLSLVGNGNDSTLTATTTDTHHLAFGKTFVPSQAQNFTNVVPATALKVIADFIDPKDTENKIAIAVDNKHFYARINNMFLTTRIIDGAFPSTDKLLNDEKIIHTEFFRNEFQAALSRVALVAVQREHSAVQLTVTQDNIELSADSDERGHVKEFIEAQSDGEITIKFNINYLMQFVATMSAQTLAAAFKDPFSPAIFTEKNNDNFSYVITPLRA